MKQMTEQQALWQLTTLCGSGEHCTHEVKEKMRKWELTEEVQERLLQHLINEHYVDDARYARAYAHDKLEYNRWGPNKIRQGLYMKRIPAALITEALSTQTLDQYVEALRPLLRDKERHLRAATPYERRMKLMRFAMQRGFTMDVIRECMDTDNIDDDE